MNINCKEIDCKQWLDSFDKKMTKNGYTKHKQNIKGEIVAYWKTFEGAYQVGFLIYDFRQYIDRDPDANRIGVQYECMLHKDYRMDLNVSRDDITVDRFEKIAKRFWETFKDD